MNFTIRDAPYYVVGLVVANGITVPGVIGLIPRSGNIIKFFL